MASEEASASGHQEVTVVVPTFRRPQLLRRAIRSVLNQTYSNLRLCIYDNASGDETEDVVRQFAREDSRVFYWEHERNIGAQANFAFGLSRVETPLFSVFADDDVLLPTFYESAAAALANNDEAMFYCARSIVDHRLLDEFLHASTTWPAGLYRPSIDTTNHMIADHFISTGVVFRSGVQSTVGAFASHRSDKSYMIAAAARHSFVVSEAEQAVFTVHATSFSAGLDANDRPGLDVAFAVGILQDALSSLESTAFPAREGTETRRRLFANAQREALYSAIFQGLANGRWSGISALLGHAEELELPAILRAALRAIVLARRVPLSRVVVEATTKAVTRAISRRRHARHSRPDFEARVAEYLRSGCERPGLLADPKAK